MKSERLRTLFAAVAMPAMLAVLQGCGGRGASPAPAPPAPATTPPAPVPAPAPPAPPPAPTSFTISTSAGPNGTIDPSSKTSIPAGTTVEFFVLRPVPGFHVASASGCGGDIESPGSNTYQAGKVTPINADCTISVAFEPMATLSAVAPRYPGAGAHWNDYVVGNSTSAVDLAWDAAADTPCVHGGEQRRVAVTGKTSCTDLVARDDLGAFTWHCQINSGGTAEFITSSGLTGGKWLSDLIDFTVATPAFKPNKVTVSDKFGKWDETPSSTWWTNPIVQTTVGSGSATSMNVPSSIHVLTSNSTGSFTLDADKVALVIQPGVTLSGPGDGFDSFVIDSAVVQPDFVWLEGAIDASGDDIGVNLIDPRFFTLRNLKSNGADGGDRSTSPDNHNIGIQVQSGGRNRLEDLTAGGNFNAGMVLRNSSRNTISRVTVASDPSGVQTHGLRIRSSSDNVVSDVTAGAPSQTCSTTAPNGNDDTGLWLSEGSVDNTARNVKAYCNNVGVLISDSTTTGNLLANIDASSNQVRGVSIVADSGTGSPNAFETLTANNNVDVGLYLEAVSGSPFKNVTANDNGIGVFLNSYFDQSNTGLTFGSDRDAFETVTADGNGTRGISLDASSDNTFTGVSPATNCPLFQTNGGVNNTCTTASTAPPAVVEFRIAAGTGAGARNTSSSMLTVTVGQTVRIINDDTTPHAFHADNDLPCAHRPFGSRLGTGQSYDCVTTAPIDSGSGPPTTWDHLHGPAASFWLKVVR